MSSTTGHQCFPSSVVSARALSALDWLLVSKLLRNLFEKNAAVSASKLGQDYSGLLEFLHSGMQRSMLLSLTMLTPIST